MNQQFPGQYQQQQHQPTYTSGKGKGMGMLDVRPQSAPPSTSRDTSLQRLGGLSELLAGAYTPGKDSSNIIEPADVIDLQVGDSAASASVSSKSKDLPDLSDDDDIN